MATPPSTPDPSGNGGPAGLLRPPVAPPETLTRQRLERALQHANLPTLTMVLFHLTGEERWLQDPFRPTPTRGLSPHDSGGFDAEVATAIRAAALEAVCAWSQGAPVAIGLPDRDLLQRMLSTCMGEEVPPEYERLMRHEMAPEGPPDLHVDEIAELSVVIVGAGLSGLLAAKRLQAMDVPYVVLERNQDVGGVWLTNIYPGAGVDTPSYLYSFVSFPRKWSTHFGKRDEMAAYAADFADHYDLRRSIRFGTSVESVTYDEAMQRWTVEATGPEGPQRFVARTVISAVGLFNTPTLPDLPGLNDFAGTAFHSAQWPEDLDLEGKRVAVVGAGASAMQIVPAIAERVDSMVVFQRSPQWVAPNAEYFAPVGDDVHWLMDHVPFYHAWYRFRLAWTFNDRVHASLQIDPEWEHPERSLNAVNDGHRSYFTRYLTDQLEGRPDLVAKALPDYPPFGKRMLLDNGWYATLKRDHVELVTDHVAAITEHGVVSAGGQEYAVDVIIFCTGFKTRHYLPGLRVVGRDGIELHDTWGEEDASANLGMTVPGFPNLFMMYGPNTNAGAGGSVIFIAECQIDYITTLLAHMAREGIGALECRPEALQRWVEEVDAAHARMVWSHPGMTTYYRNARGRVVTNSPWRIIDYWARTREPRLGDFQAEPLRRAADQVGFRPVGM